MPGRLDSKRRPPPDCMSFLAHSVTPEKLLEGKSLKFCHTFETFVLSDGDNKDEVIYSNHAFCCGSNMFDILPS